MTPADLLALAGRVEAGEGADRELDRVIYHDVLGYCRHANTERSGYQDDTGFDCLDCGADSWGNKSKLGDYPKGQRLHDHAPSFTASLDAALTLVPEGWSIGFGDLRGRDPIVWRAHLRDHRPESLTKEGHSHIWREGHAATPALALTAAALRARAAQ